MATSPVVPSTTQVSPFLMSEQAFSSESTAGISRARAMMAECDVRPPTSVTTPTTFSLSMVAVIDGVRSCTTTMESLGRTERSTSSLPRSWARMPVRMSWTSAQRSRMSCSSEASNIA